MRKTGGLLVLTVATTLAVAAAAAAHPRVSIHGYPYTESCPQAGIEDVVDRWGMYACNCTSYAAWALVANGQRIDWFVRGAMDAKNWPHVARLSGIPVGSAPRVGAVAVWPGLERPFGHVAYVTRVERNGTFDVAEYNLPPPYGFTPYVFDTRTSVHRTGAIFIYAPKRR